MDVSTLPRLVGFVLSGGGGLGAVQVGMLRALEKHGVVPDVVVGTSVGALNGVAVALDPPGAPARLAEVWGTLTRELVFPGGLLSQALTLQRARTHLFPNTGLAGHRRRPGHAHRPAPPRPSAALSWRGAQAGVVRRRWIGMDDVVLAPTDLGARMLDALEQVIAGQRAQLELALATLLSGGHLLLEDRPGVGKTVLAKAIGRVLDIPTGRIQGTADLLPTDVTGVHVFEPTSRAWTFRPGPIFTSLLLVDELNRATPKAQAALLEAMAEGQVTVDGETRALARPFMVIATQNPQGEAGTYPLGQAQVDRFATMLHLGLPGREAERGVLEGRAGGGRLGTIGPVVRADELDRCFDVVAGTTACAGIVTYVLDCVDAVRAIDPSIWLSVRVSETVLAVARGRAFMHRRDYVAPEDVQAVLPGVLAHRLPRGFAIAGVRASLARVAVPVDAG